MSSEGHGELILRHPHLEDAIAIKRIVEASGVLDVNSLYCYLLLCSHFESTCVVAELRGDVVGFTTAYRLPARPEVLFVWQIGVHESARGKGLAASMLDWSIARCPGVRFLEATVTPTNEPSKALFRSFARRFGASCSEEPFFNEHVFGGEKHEVENLLRIGPFLAGQGRTNTSEA